MDTQIAALAELYKFDNSLFENKIATLQDDQAQKQINERANPIIWIAGHLTTVRFHLMELLQDKREFPWPELFEGNFEASQKYPKISEIAQAWRQVANDMVDQIRCAPAELLDKKLSYELPHNDNTVRGALQFFCYHESWHLGQISYIRKLLGLEALVSF